MRALRVATLEECARYGGMLPPGLLAPIAGASGFGFVQSKATGGNSATPSVTYTSGPGSGDLLVAAVIAVNGGTAITMTSAGWTPLTSVIGASSYAGRMFWKNAGAGESSTVTAAAGTSGPWGMTVVEYNQPGVYATDNGQTNGFGTTGTTPSVTPSAGATAVVVCAIFEDAPAQLPTYTSQEINSSSTGVNDRAQQSTQVGVGTDLFDEFVASTTGSYSGSCSASASGTFASMISVFTALPLAPHQPTANQAAVRRAMYR